MARATNGTRGRKSTSGNQRGNGGASNGSSSGDSGSSTDTDASPGRIDGLSGIGGTVDGKDGNDGNDSAESEVHGGGSSVDSTDGTGSASGDGSGGGTGSSDRGSSDGSGTKRKRRTRAEIEAALASGIDDVKVHVPSDLSASKLGRRGRVKKADTVAAVAHGLDFLFSLPKYSLGEGYEFWGLQEAEKQDLAEKATLCLERLPQGKVSVIAKFIDQYMPFVAFAMAGYSTVAWRLELTKQTKAAREYASRTNGQSNGGVPAESNGTVDATGPSIQDQAIGSNAGSGEGIGLTTAAFGSAASLFTPPPHIAS